MPILDRVKPARLDEIRKDDGSSLWVLNNAQNNPQLRDGLLIFNVALDATDRRIVCVPNTWVPVDIGQQIPKDAILRSPDFLNSVMRRVIILIKTEDAETIFAEDAEAMAEWDRVSQDIMGRLSGDPSGMNIPNGIQVNEIEGAIDPEINTQLAEAVSRDDISENELMAVVRNLGERNNLARKDYEFILANTQYIKVREYSTNQMAKMPRNAGKVPRMA